jgi:uncharacterized protein with ACT and thioredoxin-like domain
MALPVDRETREYVAQQVAAYLESNAFEVVVLHLDGGLLGGEVAEACREVCLRKGSRFVLSVNDEDPWSDDSITKLIDALLSNLDNLS